VHANILTLLLPNRLLAMSVFERILVPLDGSVHSMHALENAAEIAKSFGAKVTLINVYSTVQPVVPTPFALPGASTTVTGPMMPPDARYSEAFAQITEAHRQAGANILAKGKEEAQGRWGIQAETLLKEGHAVEEILRTGREGKYNLIVIGARGLSAVKEILLGSVSHGVVIHASCPVMVVK
jgi:nucleotide-binding universal stress UspA family protein